MNTIFPGDRQTRYIERGFPITIIYSIWFPPFNNGFCEYGICGMVI